MKNISLSTLLAVTLFTSMVNAQSIEINKAKANIVELLKNEAIVSKTMDKNDSKYDKDTRYGWGTQKNIFVLEDRIEFRRKKETTIIYFSDLADYDIYATTDQKHNSGTIIGEFLIMLEEKEKGKELANNLIFIKDQINNEKMEKQYNPQLVLFEPLAAQYRALQVKPPISEEQRELIVQANSFTQKMMYEKAIELYSKAIEVDQTAYPAAYSNLALLSAQIQKYHAAIYYMKKYLLLEPESSDARSAQDKIYEWKISVAP